VTAYEWGSYFHIERIGHQKPFDLGDHLTDLHGQLQARQQAWWGYRLYLTPGPVIQKVREFAARGRTSLQIDPGDLRSQMSSRRWWMQGKYGAGSHKKRFKTGSSSTSTTCWGIDVSLCEMGYVQPTRELLEDSIVELDELKTGPIIHGAGSSEADWNDPRKGDLFAIIDPIMAAREKESRVM